jgi:hypothetical protein
MYGMIVGQLGKVDTKAAQAGIFYKGANSFEVMTWDPNYSPIVLHAKALASGFVAQLRPGHDFTSYGLAPCPYDLYFFCKFGPSSMLILLPLVAVLGTVILNEIRQEYDPRKVSSQIS